jgi:hypothetical protein
MKVYHHIKKNIFVPEWHCDLLKNHVKFWVYGVGRKKATKSVMVLEEIPSLSENYTYAELKEYYEKYGRACTMDALPNNADFWKEYQIRIAVSKGELLDKFEKIFDLKADKFIDHKLSCLGFVTFDIIKFDQEMQTRGYKGHGISLNKYVTDVYGEEGTTVIDGLIGVKEKSRG